MKTNLNNNALEPNGNLALSIQDFRSAMHHLARKKSDVPVSPAWLEPAQQRRQKAHRRLTLAWATCAVALCLAAVPLSVPSHHTHSTVAASQSRPTIAADSAMLQQVDADIAQPVPSSLAPLATLESWTSTNTSSNSSEKTNVSQ